MSPEPSDEPALPDLAGRTAVITGASRGLGAGMARELHRLGLRLALCARGEPELPAGERVLARCVDVRDEKAVDAFAEEAAERFGALDLWINNAGVLEPIAPLRDASADAFATSLEVNVLGVFLGTRAFVRHLRERGGEGVLINVSSGASTRAYAGWSAYCAGKAAVDHLTRCVALEEREQGLRALSVAPGVIDTDMQAAIRATPAADFPEVERFQRRKVEGAFSSSPFVARWLLRLAFDPAHRSDEVVTRLPDERSLS